jgi:hypothetical protein
MSRKYLKVKVLSKHLKEKMYEKRLKSKVQGEVKTKHKM